MPAGAACLLASVGLIVLTWGENLPCQNGQNCAEEWADYHNPEVGPCAGIEYSWTKGTRWIDGAVVDRNAHGVYKT